MKVDLLLHLYYPPQETDSEGRRMTIRRYRSGLVHIPVINSHLQASQHHRIIDELLVESLELAMHPQDITP